jgi:hypothetical protein
MLPQDDREDLELAGIEAVPQRMLDASQMRTFAGYMAEIFAALGLHRATPATLATPRRFIRARRTEFFVACGWPRGGA